MKQRPTAMLASFLSATVGAGGMATHATAASPVPFFPVKSYNLNLPELTLAAPRRWGIPQPGWRITARRARHAEIQRRRRRNAHRA